MAQILIEPFFLMGKAECDFFFFHFSITILKRRVSISVFSVMSHFSPVAVKYKSYKEHSKHYHNVFELLKYFLSFGLSFTWL